MLIKKFNISRFVHAASFLQKNSHASNYMKLLKLFFFADRYHIRNYGTLLTFDNYVALPYGTVGSQSKDILTKNPFYYENILFEDKKYLNENIKATSTYDISIHIDLDKSPFLKKYLTCDPFREDPDFLLLQKEDYLKSSETCL